VRKWFYQHPASIYWTIVTLTTVGYGDISPETPLGQFIASFVMILGYGIIAVPTGIVTAEIAKTDKIVTP
jgi:voltage-gated potassium channel